MTGALEVVFLGTGTSVGVPVIGCCCPVCASVDPRNRRTRSSALVRTAHTAVLIDSGPDLREQALRERLNRVDAVLYTHGHLDHVAGFDDLRAFCWHRDDPLPLHATPECMAILQRMFGWAFNHDHGFRGYVRPDPRLIDGPFQVADLLVTPLPVEHAGVETVGFLFTVAGAPEVAYIPDVKSLPAPTAARLEQVPVLIIDGLRRRPHPTHLTISEAVELAGRLRAGRVWLTHLGHDHDHAALESSLPEPVRVAHDGLHLSFPPP
jgi:phosphoribosyl 1,2-cyclic phosphate phosphodiesterase